MSNWDYLPIKVDLKDMQRQISTFKDTQCCWDTIWTNAANTCCRPRHHYHLPLQRKVVLANMIIHCDAQQYNVQTSTKIRCYIQYAHLTTQGRVATHKDVLMRQLLLLWLSMSWKIVA